MATFIKGKLKAARDAISKKDFAAARDAATQVLSYEANNYNANVFLGLACLELGNSEDSEKAYLNAVAAGPDQPLAWQGLSRLYERTRRWDKYAEALQRLIDLFAKSDDSTRCAETVQKLIDLRRERGTRAEVISALSLLLPDSTIYPVLSSLPPPEPTAPTANPALAIQQLMQNSLPVLEEIVTLSEKEQEQAVQKEIDKRRMRLNAGSPEEIQRTVMKEILVTSKLPSLYEEVLNHTHTSDDLRRRTESKLLRLKQQEMSTLSTKGDEAVQKTRLRNEVYDMARGAVLLDIPDELAWTIFIEWKDAETIADYDLKLLRRYRSSFPSGGLNRVILGYLLHMGIPISEGEDEEEEDETPQTLVNGDADSDPFDILLEASENRTGSVLAHRMLAEAYRSRQDWEALIQTAERGLELARQNELETGQQLRLVTEAFNVELGTGLVHLHPPKHHARALRVIDAVLAQEPSNADCLMGRGYVFEHSKKWGEAAILFAKVIQLGKGGIIELEAREERAWCWIRNEQVAKGEEALREVIPLWEAEPSADVQQARSWWRLGRCLWDLDGERRQESFKCFITSLKRCSTFAPAFTALGIYYLEAASPPDHSRASKCFQKAFELDAREGEAARRLAEGFAEEGEWDLTEVVAKRTIEGEGGLEGRGTGVDSAASRRYLPTNAWAWKALGAVELNRRNFSASIQAFQVALRAEPDDYHCWLRLGEAYARSGRQMAAIKALSRAQELNPDDWVCAYLMGDVQCQIGQFDTALDIFSGVLTRRPDDPAVLLSVADTHLLYGRVQLDLGFLSRAESSFWDAIHTALLLITGGSTFRRLGWKTACDALYQLSTFSTFETPDTVRTTLDEVENLLRDSKAGSGASTVASTLLSKDPISESLGQGSDGLATLKLAALGCEHRVEVTAYDNTGISSAWYDLAVCLRRLTSLVHGDESEGYSKNALHCIREAIRADAREPSYWNALGVMSFETNAALSQHAFLSALQIDSKDPLLWTNLGLLYLQHGDPDLANQALLRAQTLDPDQPLAWVGQALVAVYNGDEADANALFEHAVVISSGSMLEASHTFGSRVLRMNDASRRSQSRSDQVYLAFSALDRYCRERPADATVHHLHGLLCEQLGQNELAEKRISEAISLLEVQYESTEDPEIERRFAIAHGNLGRVLLLNGKSSEALESFKTVLNILPSESGDVDITVQRAHAGLCSGIAHFILEDLEQALSTLEMTLEEIPASSLEIRGHVTLTLAKTLWAVGSAEAKETAKGLLLDCISADSQNLAAITALASIGSLTEDDDLLQAALTEIQSMDREHRLQVDPNGDVDFLLELHDLAQGDVDGALRTVQDAVHAQPSSMSMKRRFARLLLASGADRSSLPSLDDGIDAEEDRSALDEDLMLRVMMNMASRNDPSEEHSVQSLQDAQKAIMFAPWKAENWAALTLVRASKKV